MSYQLQAIDTSEASDRVFFQLLRSRSSQQRLQMAASMIRNARRLSLSALRQTFPQIPPAAFAHHVALAWLQADCPAEFIPPLSEMSWIQDSISLAGLLHSLLAQQAIPYDITGGVAAIADGEPRTTRNLDMVVAVAPRALLALVTALEAAGFYVSGVADGSIDPLTILGITHIESISRANLILSGNSEFERLKFERRRVITVPHVGELNFISPEDIILTKLGWGQASHSEQQWRDVLGILKVQGNQLDRAYLSHWAAQLDVKDRCDRALAAAGLMEAKDEHPSAGC